MKKFRFSIPIYQKNSKLARLNLKSLFLKNSSNFTNISKYHYQMKSQSKRRKYISVIKCLFFQIEIVFISNELNAKMKPGLTISTLRFRNLIENFTMKYSVSLPKLFFDRLDYLLSLFKSQILRASKGCSNKKAVKNCPMNKFLFKSTLV